MSLDERCSSLKAVTAIEKTHTTKTVLKESIVHFNTFSAFCGMLMVLFITRG